jgi:hypothetical protein
VRDWQPLVRQLLQQVDSMGPLGLNPKIWERRRRRAPARMRYGELRQPEEGCQLTCDGIRLRNGSAASLRARKTRCLATRIEVSELGCSMFG